MSTNKVWNVYLSGEIHTDWRDQIKGALISNPLPVDLLTPITEHLASDECGTEILGPEDSERWKDHKGAGINAIRNRGLIERADIVVVRFGEKYRQWNTAFDAGFAAALGKSLIVIHDGELTHSLKEIDRVALAVCETPAQVIDLLAYITQD